MPFGKIFALIWHDIWCNYYVRKKKNKNSFFTIKNIILSTLIILISISGYLNYKFYKFNNALIGENIVMRQIIIELYNQNLLFQEEIKKHRKAF